MVTYPYAKEIKLWPTYKRVAASLGNHWDFRWESCPQKTEELLHFGMACDLWYF